MFIQISAGQGPSECQRVVWHVYQKMLKAFSDLKIVTSEGGREKNCFRSLTLEIVDCENLEQLRAHWEGTVSWKGKSPFRPNHKRQNWFVKVDFYESHHEESFDEALVKIETFRGSGPGGQHVNKTSTAVRAVYLPTGDAVVCMDERSQFANKQRAIERLKNKILKKAEFALKEVDADNRLLHYQLERGNAVKSFSGKL